MNTGRQQLLERGLASLPDLSFADVRGRNGEELATDEAAVWKRVLNYRVSGYLQPRRILETHKGLGISSRLYLASCPGALLFDHQIHPSELERIDLADIDPFGQPWDAISKYEGVLHDCTAVMVSNGEAYLVARGLRRAQRYPTEYSGKRMPYWIQNQYLPMLDSTLGMPCRYFYAFPTTVRSIHARTSLPPHLFDGCEKWMWWLSKYAPE